MALSSLPALTEKKADFKHFPTTFQNFIFRNWECVPTESMARVLSTDVKTVEELARGMGLRVPAKYNKEYETRGYLTIIRNNWHLLPYEQITDLLGWNEEKLSFTLKEDDFFIVKLGMNKPDVPAVKYRPLTNEEKEITEKIRQTLSEKLPSFSHETTAEDFDFIEKFDEEEKQSFDSPAKKVVLDNSFGLCDKTSGKYTKVLCDFLKEKGGISLCGKEKYISFVIKKDASKKAESHTISIKEKKIEVCAVDEFGILKAVQFLIKLMKSNNSFSFDEAEIVRDTRFDIRFIHSYCALFGDPFLDGGVSSYPDSLLKKYSEIGVNGIWLHMVLYKMCEFPFEPSVSDGWKERLSGLKALCDRAEQYGIKVYLYTNEPRTMPKSFFDTHPELLGQYTKINSSNPDGDGTLCTSTPEVQKYLYDAVKTVCEAAPNLGGFFTITASENVTNCYSHYTAGKCECKRCKERLPEDVYAEVNTIIKNAARSVNEEIEVLAYDWEWKHMCNDSLKAVESAAKSDVRVMCVSERGVKKLVGGVETSVTDYSISVVGPGPEATETWRECKKLGGKTLAKVQFNNTWECSTIPYIPALDLVKKHMDGICDSGVDGLMLNWSLGGYPSINLSAMSKYFFGEETQYDAYEEMFGKNADLVKKAVSKFSEAFYEYPFHIRSAYLGPCQMGTANLMFEKNSGLDATMTGFAYDDIENWRAVYPIETYENQLKILSEKWKAGLDLLSSSADADGKEMKEFCEVSVAGYCLMRSSYLQTKYNRLRNEFHEGKTENREEIVGILEEEMTLAVQMYEICSKNSTIGYEAANHYFFNKYSLAEKVVNVQYLIDYFAK